MHPNMALLRRLYDSLNRRDSNMMAACYHPAATFHDIAFDLKGKEQIHAMWRMICSGDVSATFNVVHADDHHGVVKLVDEYTFTDTGRKVRNPIESRFRFRDGLIVEHRDHCNARAWAAAALGGVGGFLAGRLRFLRARRGRSMLQAFIQSKA
jgi:ketosteroid isomerase-like protein